MMPSVRAAVVLVALLFSGLMASPVLAQEGEESGGSWEGLIATGNARYQETDFSGALDAYETVLQAGFESADLHYNLGNAYFKTGSLGFSILSYERALKLDPGDPDIRANLDLARGPYVRFGRCRLVRPNPVQERHPRPSRNLAAGGKRGGFPPVRNHPPWAGGSLRGS